MSDFITLTCPNCGGKLQITDDVERFACGFCGVEHIVRRSGGIVTLKPIVEGLAKVQTGVDKTASELAIVRLTSEIAEIVERVQSLAIAHNIKLSQLDQKYGIRKSRNRFSFPSWGSKIPLWIRIVVLLLTLLWFVYSAAPVFEPDAESLSQDYALVTTVCCSVPLAILAFLFLSQGWESRNRLKLIKKRDVEREILQEDYNRESSLLKEMLHDRQQQLAQHREIVSRFD